MTDTSSAPAATPSDLPSVAILLPYFGEAPPWLPFFLASCRANPAFTWILFTDFDLGDAPPNVRHHKIAFEKYVARCEEVLKIDLASVRRDSYKLTDLKPTLAYVHAELLEEFDFWAWGDMDVVYGDLATAFGDELRNYDMISCHTYVLSGHLTFLRNTRDLRALFSGVRDWRDMLTAATHKAFDEKVLSPIFFQKIQDRNLFRFAPLYTPTLMVNENPVRVHFSERYSTFNQDRLLPDGSIGSVTEWTWRDGVLTSDALDMPSMAYAHFSAWNTGRYAGLKTGKRPWTRGGMTNTVDMDAPITGFRITEDGFHPLD